jgi:hypothetical protein
MTLCRNLAILMVHYEGKKIFWEVRVEVTLLFAYHPNYDCLEIIACDSASQQEFPRIYLSFQLLLRTLRTLQLDEFEAGSPATDHSTELINPTSILLSTQFLLSRLDLSSGDCFQLFLRANKDEHFDFILVEKPIHMVAVHTYFKLK